MSGQLGMLRWKLIRFCRNGSCRRITWVAELGNGGSKCFVRLGNNYRRFAGNPAMQNFASPEAKFCMSISVWILKTR
jgi:hypothetical protein